MSYTESDVPEWDVDEFWVPEAEGWRVHLVLYEDRIGTRRYGRGSTYNMLPEDLYRGDVPMIPVPGSTPAHVVREWVVEHLDALWEYREIDDPNAKQRLGRDAIPAQLRRHCEQSGQYLCDSGWDLDPDLIALEEFDGVPTVEECEQMIQDSIDYASLYYTGSAEELQSFYEEEAEHQAQA